MEKENMVTTERRLIVLVGPGQYDYWYGLCTETPGLFVRQEPGSRHKQQWRKAEYVGIPVESQDAAEELCARIRQERKKDGAALQAYWDKRHQWEMDNPEPQPRPPQEVITALGMTYPQSS